MHVIARAAMAPKRKAANAVKAEKPAVKKTKLPKMEEDKKVAAAAATSDGSKLSLIIEAW